MVVADLLGRWGSQSTAPLPPRSTDASREERSSQSPPLSLELYPWHPSIFFTAGQTGLQNSPWVALALQVAEGLIQENDWPLQTIGSLDTTRLLASGANTGKLAIATLPIALFFHDDLLLQQQHLRQTVQTWGGTPSMEDWAAVFGYAIAQMLKEQLNPSQLISHLLSDWSGADPDLRQRSPQILPALELLGSLIEQGTASRLTVLRLEELLPQDHKTIALALYCFLCTPDSWQLSVLHAARFLPINPVLGALTGCLSGAYNSHSSLPIAWKTASLQSFSCAQSSSAPITCAELATRLLAAWSGMFDSSHRLAANTLPVASPRFSYSRSL